MVSDILGHGSIVLDHQGSSQAIYPSRDLMSRENQYFSGNAEYTQTNNRSPKY